MLMPETYPYSMTDYWSMLKHDMAALKETDEDFFSLYIPLNTTLDMVDLGLKFEEKHTSALSLEPTMNKIVETSEGIGPKVSLSCMIEGAEKTHQYHLPNITDTNTLLFAILYHKHLRLFAKHTYKGPFGDTFPLYIKSKIDAKTDSKRPWSIAQADYLKASILNYIAQEKLSLTEKDLLPDRPDLSSKAFIKTLKEKLPSKTQSRETAEEETETPTTESAKVDRLKTNLSERQAQLEAAKLAIKAFSQLKANYETSYAAYNTAEREARQHSRLNRLFLSKSSSTPINALKEAMIADKTKLALAPNQTPFMKIKRLLAQQKKAEDALLEAKIALEQEQSRIVKKAESTRQEEANKAAELKEQAHHSEVARSKVLPTYKSTSNPAHVNNSFFHPIPNRQCVAATLIGTAVTAATTALLYYSM